MRAEHRDPLETILEGLPRETASDGFTSRVLEGLHRSSGRRGAATRILRPAVAMALAALAVVGAALLVRESADRLGDPTSRQAGARATATPMHSAESLRREYRLVRRMYRPR